MTSILLLLFFVSMENYNYPPSHFAPPPVLKGITITEFLL